MQLPVAEAMVTYKEEKTSGEESSQVFLPFLSDVRVGSDGVSGTCIDSCWLGPFRLACFVFHEVLFQVIVCLF